MIPVVFPDKHIEETNILTETVINDLTMQQMEVIDIVSTDGINSQQLDQAMRTNNYMAMRNIASKHLSGTILIGKVETTTTAKEVLMWDMAWLSLLMSSQVVLHTGF